MTYSTDLIWEISDLHKDVYGVRPRGSFFADWEAKSEADKQETWDDMVAELEYQHKREAARKVEDVAQMEADIEAYIAFGARDRKDALRWMTQNETFYSGQCVESWVWDKGILFTDYGKAIVKDLLQVVKYNTEVA